MVLTDVASIALSAGYVGAKERMEMWGEELAEEERRRICPRKPSGLVSWGFSRSSD